MGFRFRKSLRILPGVKINISKKGISSLSVGKPGLTTNAGRKGITVTASAPGTGFSFFNLFKW